MGWLWTNLYHSDSFNFFDILLHAKTRLFNCINSFVLQWFVNILWQKQCTTLIHSFSMAHRFRPKPGQLDNLIHPCCWQFPGQNSCLVEDFARSFHVGEGHVGGCDLSEDKTTQRGEVGPVKEVRSRGHTVLVSQAGINEVGRAGQDVVHHTAMLACPQMLVREVFSNRWNYHKQFVSGWSSPSQISCWFAEVSEGSIN